MCRGGSPFLAIRRQWSAQHRLIHFAGALKHRWYPDCKNAHAASCLCTRQFFCFFLFHDVFVRDLRNYYFCCRTFVCIFVHLFADAHHMFWHAWFSNSSSVPCICSPAVLVHFWKWRGVVMHPSAGLCGALPSLALPSHVGGGALGVVGGSAERVQSPLVKAEKWAGWMPASAGEALGRFKCS